MTAKRPQLFSGNWKMFENHFESLTLIQELAALLRARGVPDGCELSVHPPFTSLRTVQTAIETDRVPIAIGAQTCHFDDRGAFTGEVSPEMLAKLNVAFVIVGHSERRTWCGETDEIVRKKLDAVLRHAMRPILCVGETREARDGGRAVEVVVGQLRSALEGRSTEDVTRCVVAYEPLWAIGSGVHAEPEDAEAMGGTIRETIAQIAGHASDACAIQYGGSVNPENAASFLACPSIDGLLVGGASLDATKFVDIVHASE